MYMSVLNVPWRCIKQHRVVQQTLTNRHLDECYQRVLLHQSRGVRMPRWWPATCDLQTGQPRLQDGHILPRLVFKP